MIELSDAVTAVLPNSPQMVVLDEADEMLDMGFAEDIDAILAALAGMQTATPIRFTRDATDCAADFKDKKIVLIDGNRLTRLMLDAGVGVSVKETYRVHRIDEDFFAEFEEE